LIKHTHTHTHTHTEEIIRDYFENIHSIKLENLEEMDKFPDTCEHPKLNEEDINHTSRSLICNEIKAAIKSLPKRKVQDLTDSLLNSIRPLKKNYFQHSSNFFMK
jgi:glutamyl-tRNA reductase